MKKAAAMAMWIFAALLLSMGLVRCASILEPETVSECVTVKVIGHRTGRKSDYFLVQMPNERTLAASAGAGYAPNFLGNAVAARLVGRWTHHERLMLLDREKCISMVLRGNLAQ